MVERGQISRSPQTDTAQMHSLSYSDSVIHVMFGAVIHGSKVISVGTCGGPSAAAL